VNVPAVRPKITDLLGREFLARLDALDVISRKIFQGKMQGERRSKRRGQSVEFADHRPYSVGDDLRFVDWNTYARLEQLFIKLFIEEQDLSVRIVLDASASSAQGLPAKDLAMKKLASALGYVALVNNNRLTLSTIGQGVVDQTESLRGRPRTGRMAEFLLGCQCQGPTDFTKACRQLQAMRSGSGVMVIISDFLFKEGYAEGLRRLLTPSYDLYIIQVLSPQELDPPLTGDLKLLDVEDGDSSEITVSPALIKFYKRSLAVYCQELKEFCTRRGANYVLANSADSIETLMLSHLRRRGLLR
jgi:uncharacterized protein (DUF58 family)